MVYFARMLIIIGFSLLLAGVVILVAVRYFPWLGNLPGDIRHEGENVRFYFPIATMLLISLIASILLNVVLRLFGK